jgi:hypothetical protein
MTQDIIINTEELLQSILTKVQNPREKSYVDASEECIKMAEGLIETCPELDHVKSAKNKYLFKLGTWVKAGECSKASGKWRHLTDFDFVIVFHKDTWDASTIEQRYALIHHELSHIGRKDSENWYIIPHDVEEFLSTYKRYGAWNGSLQMLVSIINDQSLRNNDE